MKEIYGNIFDIIKTGEFKAFCVTTNGVVTNNGSAVMGAGIALECKKRWKNIPSILGAYIKEVGNHVHLLGSFSGVDILSFPTKDHWRNDSDINLIRRSCTELMDELNFYNINKILLPQPGCGNGGLLWENVKPEIENLLDDRVFIVGY